MMRAAFIGLVAAALAVGAASAMAHAASTRPALANPAAVLCAKNGATIEKEVAADGSQRGLCVFPDGARIDEWTYFRNKTRTH